MLPDSGIVLKSGFQIKEKPGKTFALHPDTLRIAGWKDGLEAIEQTIFCILNTERYDWLIYSWNYGTELKDLFGKPMLYAQAKIKRRIEEALMQDDRIKGVDDFSFEELGNRLSVTFTVHTTKGDLKIEREVTL